MGAVRPRVRAAAALLSGVALLGAAASVQAQSSDATLSDLKLRRNANIVVPISPEFASATTEYTAEVGRGRGNIRVDPTTNHSGASWVVEDCNGNEIEDANTNQTLFVFNMPMRGFHTFCVVVTAEDGVTKGTYTVTVSRGSTDAQLSRLIVSWPGADSDIELSPEFSKTTTTYTADVWSTEQIRIDADLIGIAWSKNQSDAELEILDGDGNEWYSQHLAHNHRVFSLALGENVFRFVLTAENGVNTLTYNLTLIRGMHQPTVLPEPRSATSLRVTWPEVAGDVVTYDLRYRVHESGADFTDGPQNVTDTHASITGLTASTYYEVEVRAIIDAVETNWSLGWIGLTHPPAVTVPIDWSLRPDEFGPGQRFRLLYLSSRFVQAAHRLHNYNTWVAHWASGDEGVDGRGHADIQAYASGFRIVGCTLTVSALWNADLHTSDFGVYRVDEGVPIYWLNGGIVATDYPDLLDGSWQNEDDPRTEEGLSTTTRRAWTGCVSSGKRHPSNVMLGRPSYTAVGILNDAVGRPLNEGRAESVTSFNAVYALSQEFMVAQVVESVTRNRPDSSPTNEDELTWLVQFSGDVRNVDATDFNLTGTTAGLSVVSQSASQYLVSASGGNLTELNGTVTLSFDTGHDIQDTLGSAIASTTPTDTNDNTYDVDNMHPSVTITVPATNTGKFEALFEFTESMTGFALDDIVVNNGSASNYRANAQRDAFRMDITARRDGTVTVDVPEDAARDEAGNGNTAAATAASTAIFPPTRPGPPTVTGVDGSPTSLLVSWDAPHNPGSGSITYSLRYRVAGGNAGWSHRTGLGGTSETIGSLAEATFYEVQVRATKDNVAGPWSHSGRGRTGESVKPSCDLSAADVTVHEGETARFKVAIPRPLPRDDVLIWHTHDNQASSRQGDFEYASGQVNLNTGASEFEVAVKTLADNAEEPTERFQVLMGYDSWNKRPDWRGIAWCAVDIYIRDGKSNGAPVFDEGGGTTRTVAENAAPGEPVGKPVTATDPNDDPLTYALDGADAASFAIDAGTGQLRTRAALDHESKASYAITVVADDGRGGTATISVTVEVTDDKTERPPAPGAPTVAPNSSDCLDVSWTAPAQAAGDPPITHYRTCHAPSDRTTCISSKWRAGTSATLCNLSADTEYGVKVQARDGDTDKSDHYRQSAWSPWGYGRTLANGAPTFAEGARAVRSVAENTPRERPVGAPVAAEDPDGDKVYYSLEGPDAETFRIDAHTGQLLTRGALDHESKAGYAVTVKADDRIAGAATIDVTVRVSDVDEPPDAPYAPTVTVGAGHLSVQWNDSAAEGGPPVEGYDLRHRKAGGSGWTDGPRDVPGTAATIDGLDGDTEYDVQVRARNHEGESGWSGSGRGRTAPDDQRGARTVRMGDVTVHEGETAEFTIRVSPAPAEGDGLWLSWRTIHHGSALPGEDFREASGRVRLQPGQDSVAGSVETLADDDDFERTETLQIAMLHFGTEAGGGEVEVESYAKIHIRNGPRPPSAPAARVDGGLLTLLYGEPLDAGPAPGPKDFVVRAESEAGYRTLAVSGASVSGAEVSLSLSPPALPGESVTVSYLPWAMHPLLLGPGGVEAPPFTELAARNETLATTRAGAPEESPSPADGAPAPEPLGPWLASLLADRPPASLARLDLRGRGLADASFVAAFTGLEVLDLGGNAVADLWPLAGLAGLRRLDLSDNRIADVSALAGLASLEVLVLDGNRIADVLPLALLPRLARLDLSGNRVADALLLAELRLLERLDLSGNPVRDAGPLGDLSRLVWLDLSGSPVSDLAPIGRLTALRWLGLDGPADGLEALSPLSERPGSRVRLLGERGWALDADATQSH